MTKPFKLIITQITEYAHKPYVRLCANPTSYELGRLTDVLALDAKKGEFEVGDIIEVMITKTGENVKVE